MKRINEGTVTAAICVFLELSGDPMTPSSSAEPGLMLLLAVPQANPSHPSSRRSQRGTGGQPSYRALHSSSATATTMLRMVARSTRRSARRRLRSPLRRTGRCLRLQYRPIAARQVLPCLSQRVSTFRFLLQLSTLYKSINPQSAVAAAGTDDPDAEDAAGTNDPETDESLAEALKEAAKLHGPHPDVSQLLDNEWHHGSSPPKT